MLEITTRSRVDAFWSDTMGVSVADLAQPGIRVLLNPSQRELWRGIYVLALGDAVSVFVPADHQDKVTVATAGLPGVSLLEPGTWRSLLGPTVRSVFGPIVHTYLDDASGLSEHAQGRRINPGDAGALIALREAVPSAEWVEAGFSAQPAVLFGIFDGDRIVAAANLTAGPDAATDIGLVTHPEARGRGLAIQICATAARQAIALHGVARFRIAASSPPTLAIANRLGFVEYGRNLAAYLTE
jgi:GNAT superfamily N-acetyltransferase